MVLYLSVLILLPRLILEWLCPASGWLKSAVWALVILMTFSLVLPAWGKFAGGDPEPVLKGLIMMTIPLTALMPLVKAAQHLFQRRANVSSL